MMLKDVKVIVIVDMPSLSMCIPMTYFEWCSKAYDYKDFEIRYMNYKNNCLEIHLEK